MENKPRFSNREAGFCVFREACGQYQRVSTFCQQRPLFHIAIWLKLGLFGSSIVIAGAAEYIR